jgi:hypothetical protein
MSETLMKKRQAAIDEAYEAQWDSGKGSHHPDYNPRALGPHVEKATRETEELLNAIIKARLRSVLAPQSLCLHARQRLTVTARILSPRSPPTERRPSCLQEDRGGR